MPVGGGKSNAPIARPRPPIRGQIDLRCGMVGPIASKSEQAINWPVYQPRNWGIPTKARALPKPWFGLDTERNTQPGFLPDGSTAIPGEFVCGWAVGESLKQFTRLEDLDPGTYWIWNLAYDIEGMLRDLGVEEAWAARQDGAKFELLGLLRGGLLCHGFTFPLAG